MNKATAIANTCTYEPWTNKLIQRYPTRWNPNTSISSNMILMVWHRAMSWCNTCTTFFTGAACLDAFFHNWCKRSRRTVQNKTTHHFFNVKDKLNKSFKHTIELNERSRVTYSSLVQSLVSHSRWRPVRILLFSNSCTSTAHDMYYPC